ncbi:MAG: N-acyl-phosphatidylethanolamine-hydrolyzing phospholipase D [Gammaproteobacteria bacterium]|jgi:N-acyl-phosphatidylethanolamine-hydrolysing phospholipase D
MRRCESSQTFVGLLANRLGVFMLVSAVVISSTQCLAETNGQKWHHLDNGTFRNPVGSAQGTATFGDMLSFFGRRMRDKPPQVPPTHVVPQTQALQTYNATAGQDTVTWLGHAAFLLRLNGKTVLTDPYLTKRAGRLGLGPNRYVEPGLALASLPPIDVVLVSHNHYDHLDANTIEALPNKDRIHVVVPLGLGEFFEQRGYVNVIERDWYESTSIDGIEIQVLPAIHFSRRGAFDRNRTLWGGFAIRTPTIKIYHSGDTGYGPVFKEIGERAGPFDLALVAIGAYLPTSIMKPVHLTPEEALAVVDDVKADVAVGMHWGTVQLTDEDPFEPPERFRAAASARGWSANRAQVMRIGETKPLSKLLEKQSTN